MRLIKRITNGDRMDKKVSKDSRVDQDSMISPRDFGRVMRTKDSSTGFRGIILGSNNINKIRTSIKTQGNNSMIISDVLDYP